MVCHSLEVRNKKPQKGFRGKPTLGEALTPNLPIYRDRFGVFVWKGGGMVRKLFLLGVVGLLLLINEASKAKTCFAAGQLVQKEMNIFIGKGCTDQCPTAGSFTCFDCICWDLEDGSYKEVLVYKKYDTCTSGGSGCTDTARWCESYNGASYEEHETLFPPGKCMGNALCATVTMKGKDYVGSFYWASPYTGCN